VLRNVLSDRFDWYWIWQTICIRRLEGGATERTMADRNHCIMTCASHSASRWSWSSVFCRSGVHIGHCCVWMNWKRWPKSNEKSFRKRTIPIRQRQKGHWRHNCGFTLRRIFSFPSARSMTTSVNRLVRVCECVTLCVNYFSESTAARLLYESIWVSGVKRYETALFIYCST